MLPLSCMHESLIGVHCLVHFRWLICHWQEGRWRSEIDRVVQDVKWSKQTKMFLSQVNFKSQKHVCRAFPLSELKLKSTADRRSHYCTKSCLSMYLYKSGIPVSRRQQVALYQLATVTYNNQGQARLVDSAPTRKHCCYSFWWSQALWMRAIVQIHVSL